jgi:hypothetical protein
MDLQAIEASSAASQTKSVTPKFVPTNSPSPHKTHSHSHYYSNTNNNSNTNSKISLRVETTEKDKNRINRRIVGDSIETLDQSEETDQFEQLEQIDNDVATNLNHYSDVRNHQNIQSRSRRAVDNKNQGNILKDYEIPGYFISKDLDQKYTNSVPSSFKVEKSFPNDAIIDNYVLHSPSSHHNLRSFSAEQKNFNLTRYELSNHYSDQTLQQSRPRSTDVSKHVPSAIFGTAPRTMMSIGNSQDGFRSSVDFLKRMGATPPRKSVSNNSISFVAQQRISTETKSIDRPTSRLRFSSSIPMKKYYKENSINIKKKKKKAKISQTSTVNDLLHTKSNSDDINNMEVCISSVLVATQNLEKVSIKLKEVADTLSDSLNVSLSFQKSGDQHHLLDISHSGFQRGLDRERDISFNGRIDDAENRQKQISLQKQQTNISDSSQNQYHFLNNNYCFDDHVNVDVVKKNFSPVHNEESFTKDKGLIDQSIDDISGSNFTFLVKQRLHDMLQSVFNGKAI